MALDDFKDEEEFGIGDLESEKQMQNIGFGENVWKYIFSQNPQIASYVANKSGKEATKRIVMVIDRVIQEGVDDEEVDMEVEEQLEEIREDIVLTLEEE